MLSNKENRQKYDAIRQFGMGGARFAGGSGQGGFDAGAFSDIFGSMFGGGAGMGGNGSRIRFQTNGGGNPNLNDIFSMFGGGAGGPGAGSAYERYGADDYEQPQPENGEDRNSKIRLTFRQAVKGATVSLSTDGKKFKTHIPAGVHDGQKIRLTGKGKPGRNGGKNGDLYLHITVAEDPKFTLRGRDIIMPLPITVSQAVNGAKVTAKDIDGNEITFKVPAGSSSGAEVRISGKGVVNPHENGDLVGRVEIRVPEHPNLVAKHAAKEFDKACGVFSVGAAGELANVHPQTLRQYDRLGLVVPQRTEGGARRYSLRDISRLAQAQQLSQEEGINLAGITRILELEEENRELRRQVERLRKPAGSSVFAADADGGIVEVERSQRARMWRRQLRADARQLPSRESVRAERAEEGDDMGSRSVVVWGIR